MLFLGYFFGEKLMELGILLALCLIVLESTLVLDAINRALGIKRFTVIYFALFILAFDRFAVSFGAVELAPLTVLLTLFSIIILPARGRVTDILIALFCGTVTALISLYNPKLSFLLVATVSGVAAGGASENNESPLRISTAAVVFSELICCLIDAFSSGTAYLSVGVCYGNSALVASVCIAYVIYALKLTLLRERGRATAK